MNESNENVCEVNEEKIVTEILDPIKTDVEIKTDELDPYAYLNRGEFTSEKFKIEIRGLPKYYGINEFRKLLNEKLKLGSNKIKTPHKRSAWAYVCFRNDEDRIGAIKALNNFVWKGKTLSAENAKAAPDPLVKKRKDASNEPNVKKQKVDDQSQEEQLKNSTTPFWNIPYEEQLQRKHNEIREILKKMGKNLSQQNSSLREWLDQQELKNDGLPCELWKIRSATQIDGYRNKCEFTIGIDEETQLPTVGFRIGSYATGVTGVGPVDFLKHIPDSMKTAVKTFEHFIRSSDLQVFNPELQKGHFRQLTARSATDQLMLIVGIHPQTLTEDQLTEFKNQLKDFFQNGQGQQASVTSLYFQKIVKRQSNDDRNPAEHILGDTHIYENILGLKFRISPEAFFQVNTAGAEILYSSAIELASPTLDSTVVDVCCGTGTIGLCFAKSCKQVLGVELIPEAVIDAKENAKNNGIENAEFFAGKAEEILSSVMYRATQNDVIAIVDPPRAGLHQKAIIQLRKSKKLNKLVYISCNPALAVKNFVDLGRPASKTMHGDPFVPVKAVAVDMFPHTKHCELVIFFERWNSSN